FTATIEGKKVTVEIANTAATPDTATLTITGASLYTDKAYAADAKFTTQATNAAATQQDLINNDAKFQGSVAGLVVTGADAGTYLVDGNGTLTIGGEVVYAKGAGTSSES